MADNTQLRATIIVVSETASRESATDKCIPALQETFAAYAAGRFDTGDTLIVPDNILEIQRAVLQKTDCSKYSNLIVTSGGTGFAQKDVTPEV